MKITKYPQSCLRIPKDGRAILVDVGTLATAQYKVADFGRFDAVMFTHSHPDHLDVAAIKDLVASGATIYGNQDVADRVGGDRVEVMDDSEELVVAGFKVETRHMEHCLMIDGSRSVPNTGLLIDGRLLLPGDSTEDIGLEAEILALPVFGPDIHLHDAFNLVKAAKAKISISGSL